MFFFSNARKFALFFAISPCRFLFNYFYISAVLLALPSPIKDGVKLLSESGKLASSRAGCALQQGEGRGRSRRTPYGVHSLFGSVQIVPLAIGFCTRFPVLFCGEVHLLPGFSLSRTSRSCSVRRSYVTRRQVSQSFYEKKTPHFVNKVILSSQNRIYVKDDQIKLTFRIYHSTADI